MTEENKPTEKQKTITFKINANILVIIVLVILLTVSVAQAVELGNLKDKISSGEVKAATTNTSGTSSGGSSQPANLQDLPSMVGGC